MPDKKYKANAKSRILESAVAVFATKGFNGSRVDEVAKAANVPKSLIYYHFKSKEAILDELVANCLDQYKKILTTIAIQPGSSDTQLLLERIRTTYWKFLEENEDIIRVICMESLKKDSPNANVAFKFTELLIEIEKDFFKQTGLLQKEELESHMVAEFFTSQIPVVMFFCLRQTWSDAFKTNPDKLTQQFLKAYGATYGAYQRNRLG
ncbi:MAG: TetR/AcrR family transcriptional regulator [Pseudomonadota bacterium]